MAAFQEDPLNQTLKFDAKLKFWRPAGETEIKHEERFEEGRSEEGEKHVKRGMWRHEAPKTLLNALANMEVSSICSTYSSTQGKWHMKNMHTYTINSEHVKS